jgi:hypothetical protein
MDADTKKLHDYLDCHEWHAVLTLQGKIKFVYDDENTMWWLYECTCGGKARSVDVGMTKVQYE